MEFGSPGPNEVLAERFCQYRQYQDGLVRLYYRCLLIPLTRSGL